MKMKLKKETKHTVVYEVVADEFDCPEVETVYVSKNYLRQHKTEAGGWPKEIILTVTPVK